MDTTLELPMHCKAKYIGRWNVESIKRRTLRTPEVPWEFGRDKLKHVPQNRSVRSDVGHALACPANGDRCIAVSTTSGARSLGRDGGREPGDEISPMRTGSRREL